MTTTLRLGLVSVGDELLAGAVLDTNAAWLGQRVREVGAQVTAAVTVPDDVEAIAAAIRGLAVGRDAVVVSGGLGPTLDDVTRPALAAAAGTTLRRDPDLLALIEATYRRRGREIPDAAARMAEVPTGGAALANRVGTAPGLRVDVAGTPVVAVPGVPREHHALVDDHLVPLLRTLRPGAVRTRTLRVALLGESAVAHRLAPLEAALAAAGDAAPRLAYLAAPGDVLVKLTATGADADTAARALEPWVERARSLLGTVVYAEDGTTLDRVVHTLLATRGATVAVAESLTGGLLGAALTDMAGSSASFRGGVTAYATDLKAALLGVDRRLLAAEGAVHPHVAAAMARGARARLGATYGVATTGVAGPDPQDGRPPGTLHVAVAGPEGERLASPVVPGDRDMVRSLAVVYALDVLRRALAALPEYDEDPPRPGTPPLITPLQSP